MRSYKIVIIVVAVLVVGAFLGFIITGFATAGEFSHDYTITYDPSSPEPIEDLTITADIGKIIVQYNSSATTHYANIETNIKVAGLFMAGKSYTDFYHPSSEWWDEPTKTFTLTTLPQVWFDPSHWFSSYNINITVTLRTDVIYDLFIESSTGAVEMYVPDNVVLNRTYLHTSTGSLYLETSNNVLFNGHLGMKTSTGSSQIYATGTEFNEGYYVETSTGSLTLNFTNCIMGDDIEGLVSTGGITYKSYNMNYTENLNLHLETSTGSINAFIYQYNNMNANVTSQLKTSTGNISVLYRDTIANIGVRFVSSTSTGSITYTSDPTMEILGDLYQSINYGTATQRYTFTLETSTGSIAVDGESA